MGTANVDPNSRHGNWLGSVGLTAVHLAAFGSLYLILVQIFFAFEDHYRLIGYVSTPRFSWISSWSNWIAAYTPIVLAVIAVDVIIVWRLTRRSSRWTSLYSHSVLMTMGFVGFLWIAWMITPMVWSRPLNAAQSVASGLDHDDAVRQNAMSRTPAFNRRDDERDGDGTQFLVTSIDETSAD